MESPFTIYVSSSVKAHLRLSLCVKKEAKALHRFTSLKEFMHSGLLSAYNAYICAEDFAEFQEAPALSLSLSIR